MLDFMHMYIHAENKKYDRLTFTVEINLIPYIIYFKLFNTIHSFLITLHALTVFN